MLLTNLLLYMLALFVKLYVYC